MPKQGVDRGPHTGSVKPPSRWVPGHALATLPGPSRAVPPHFSNGHVSAQAVWLGQVSEVVQVVRVEDADGPVCAATENQLFTHTNAAGQRHLGKGTPRGCAVRGEVAADAHACWQSQKPSGAGGSRLTFRSIHFSKTRLSLNWQRSPE